MSLRADISAVRRRLLDGNVSANANVNAQRNPWRSTVDENGAQWKVLDASAFCVFMPSESADGEPSWSTKK